MIISRTTCPQPSTVLRVLGYIGLKKTAFESLGVCEKVFVLGNKSRER